MYYIWMKKDAKIYIAGHTWLVWSTLVKKLQEKGYTNLLLKTRTELDLLNQNAVYSFLEQDKPEYVILCAARVGGIKANMTYPADFLFQNLQIQNNVIWGSHLAGVEKLLFLWSSCIYPKWSPQPMKEEYLLDWKPEPTNEGYALAKIAWIKLCEKIFEQFGKNYISCMPTNIYGPWDNFDPETSHVVPSLIRRMHEAKINNIENVEIWWSGIARRELFYVDDLADVILFLMEKHKEKEFLNVWTWEDISIKELAYLIKDIVRYKWELVFNKTKPDGMLLKKLNVDRLNSMGYKYSTSLKEGLLKTYEYFKKL